MSGAAFSRAARRVSRRQSRRYAYSAPFGTRASAIVRCETPSHAGSAQFANWDSNTVLKPISLQIFCVGQTNYFHANRPPAILFRLASGGVAADASQLGLERRD